MPESGRVFTFGAGDTLVATGDTFYGGVQLYSVTTGEKLATMHPQNHAIHSLVFSPKGTYMASAGGGWHDPFMGLTSYDRA
jgi:WD40 repeat protein